MHHLAEHARARVEALFWSAHSFTWDAGVERAAAAARTAAVVARLAALRRGPGERVLDVGCATGEHAVALARVGFAVTGVDLSAAMVRRARRRARAAGVPAEFMPADFNRPLPFAAGAFDRVLCAAALQCAHDPATTLGELRRVLAPGGVLALSIKAPGVAAAAPPRGAYVARLFAPLKRVASRRARHWSAAELRAFAAAAGLAEVECREAGGTIELTARAP